ncbi:adenylosuccinate lyase family protein [Cereibacter changlensis]|uniref:Adenylosuccinate lyase family protein n=1 Tax=Cereibacter changlensis TaxID=402884 RepID=A0A4U0Z030_9RHOB|nr:adenylosuccinate lyase family protein [Cereibacter changlensis]TKA97478.1 adenylosuccinate lyase family protein [Cereibacter changlensis]
MERTGEYIDASSRMLDYRGMRSLYSQDNVYQAWLDVEAAAALVQADMGIIPREAGEAIAALCRLDQLDMARVEADYARMRHPLMPLLHELVRKCGPDHGRFVHWGLATQNIQQTTTLLLAQRGHRVLLDVLVDIIAHLSDLASRHAEAPMAGRTHGQHAVPITLGFKLAIWIDELLQAYERLRAVEPRVFTVTMGGAVGAFNAIGPKGPEMQRRVAARLGMHDMSLPSRSNRTHMAEYVQVLALTASTFHKMADEVAQSSSVEYGELFEVFADGVIGSSTMPQKVNPKLSMGLMANCHKLYGLSSMILTTAHRPFEGDACANVIYDTGCAEVMEIAIGIFVRAEALVAGLRPDLARMERNLHGSDGRIFSEGIMMKLAKKIGKAEAHDVVYRAAMDSVAGKGSFFELVRTDENEALLFDRTENGLTLKTDGLFGLSTLYANSFAEKGRSLSLAHRGEVEEAGGQRAGACVGC